MNFILPLVIGLVVGGIAAWFAASAMSRAKVAETQGKLASKQEEAEKLLERVSQMNTRIDELNASLKSEAERRAASEARAERTAALEEESTRLRTEITNLKATLAQIEETLKKEREATMEKLKLLEEARASLTDAFKALSSEALNTNNEAFLKLAKSTLETFHVQAKGDLTEREKAIQTLVQPLRESLERYEKQTGELEKTRVAAYSGLEGELKRLLETGESLKKETGKLVTALSAPQVRGHWGEITLRRVAELAGMVERCDFVEQESVDSPQGRLRPDMIVNLPNDRKIVVDAKATLKAYIEAIEATTEEERQIKHIEHAKQLRSRVTELCKKEYWDQFREAPEFVVMFLPGEQFLGAALQVDPDLLEDAFTKRVIIATPTTLIALLKAVAYGWRQEALAENAQQISDLGKQLYERLATMADHLSELGKSLDKSIQSYNRAIGSFESRVLVSARKFRELGTTDKSEIPTLEQIDHTSKTMLPIGYEPAPGFTVENHPGEA